MIAYPTCTLKNFKWRERKAGPTSPRSSWITAITFRIRLEWCRRIKIRAEELKVKDSPIKVGQFKGLRWRWASKWFRMIAKKIITKATLKWEGWKKHQCKPGSNHFSIRKKTVSAHMLCSKSHLPPTRPKRSYPRWRAQSRLCKNKVTSLIRTLT